MALSLLRITGKMFFKYILFSGRRKNFLLVMWTIESLSVWCMGQACISTFHFSSVCVSYSTLSNIKNLLRSNI
jgi:hypothetical protein